jgi:hypothetical protein
MVKKSTTSTLFYIGKFLPLFSVFSLFFSNLFCLGVNGVAAG